MKNPLFVGSSVAIVTPFDKGMVDYEAFSKLIEIQKLNGTSAITVCGTTGEASTMTDTERFDVIKFTKDICKNIPVIAGSGSNSTIKALENSIIAAEAGADALLVVTPYYNKATDTGLIRHYTYIADRVNKPVILYNVPSRTGVTIKPETYAALSQHDNIIGAKEASVNLSDFIKSRNLCPEDFYFWSGNDDLTVPMMSLGAKGVISVAANIIPNIMSDMASYCLEGNFSFASTLAIRYRELIDALFVEVNPIPVKAALSLMNLCKNELRLPLTSMDKNKEIKLYEIMKNSGLL